MKQWIGATFVSVMTMLASLNVTDDFIMLILIYWVTFAASYVLLEPETTKKTESKG